MSDLNKRYSTLLPGIYSENVERGILWESVDFLRGEKTSQELTSNLEDHAYSGAHYELDMHLIHSAS